MDVRPRSPCEYITCAMDVERTEDEQICARHRAFRLGQSGT